METQRNFLHFPLEVILEVFSWCSKSDLLSLTLVCKDFNEVISNCSKLMERVSLTLTPAKVKNNEIWGGIRKYSHVLVQSSHPQKALIFRDNKNYLTNLEIKDIKVRLECLRKTFFKFPYLKHLKLDSICVRPVDNGYFEGPLPALDLDTLYLKCDKKILFFLMNTQTKKLTVNSSLAMPDERLPYKLFLKSQKFLKEFITCGLYVDHPIFDSGQLNQVEFRLEKLVMKNLCEKPVPNFTNFLENHRESLKEVNITNLAEKGDFCDDVLNHLSTFKNLKRLVLTSVDPTFKPMPYVEELLFLRVRAYTNLKWSDKFLNVERLILSCDDNEKIKELINLKKLQCLVVYHATPLPSIKIPITFRRIRAFQKPNNEIRYFEEENERLRGLLTETCNLTNFVYDRIRALQRSIQQINLHRLNLQH
ncbi:unnamed protein product [Chironomus riparius]|uniref:F-box domain-containing protein n=1 Tax=Chironomus riparius TaxID=315576 RepID=A0A9N9WT45_9DIPT|nr:unnamed protein product [Chironomus riparius]